MVDVYKTRYGYYKDKDANIIGPRLQQLINKKKKKGGKLVPQDVVDDAENEASPLHKYFQWDDDKAANSYRKVQARNLIRCITIVKEELDNTPIPAFVHVSDGSGKNSDEGYLEIDVVISEGRYRRQKVNQAIDELFSWKEKYEMYSELEGLFKAISKMRDKIKMKDDDGKALVKGKQAPVKVES